MKNQYTRSPLTEAVIELRVLGPEGASLETLASVRSGYEDAYPTVRKRFDGPVELAIGDRIELASDGTQTGFVFVSVDERHVVHVGFDQFAFSRLAPYENWESFNEAAFFWWRRYCNIIQPKIIKRIAVRYINRLIFPLPIDDFRDYLRTYPEIAPDLPQGVSGYFLQLHIPQEDEATVLTLNQALADGVDSNTVSVILDIDLFRGVSIPNDNPEEVWGLLEWFRTRKNEVFEKCITDKTRRLIQ